MKKILLFLNACILLQSLTFGMEPQKTQAVHNSNKEEELILDTDKLLHDDYETTLEIQKNTVDAELIKTMLNNKNFPTSLKQMVNALKNIKENHDCLPLAILLYGKPGVGKSLLAKGIAVISNIVFLYIDCPLLGNKYQNSGSNMLQKAISPVFINNNKPYVIILDEVGSVMETNENNNNHNADVPFAFLSLFNEIKETNPYAFIIGTTNSYEKFPEAVKSRFRRNIEIPSLLSEDREGVLMHYFKKFGIEVNNTLVVLMAKNTNNFAGRDLEDLAQTALRMLKSQNDYNTSSTKLLLTQDIAQNALQEIKNDPNFLSLHPTWFMRFKSALVKAGPYLIPSFSLGLGLWAAVNQYLQFNKQYTLSTNSHNTAVEGLQVSKNSYELSKQGLEVSREGLEVSKDSLVETRESKYIAAEASRVQRGYFQNGTIYSPPPLYLNGPAYETYDKYLKEQDKK